MSEDPTPYGQHDATVALRLELGRERDRANAFEAALRKEVLAIVRDEIAKAKACEAENARLKAEVERLKEVIRREVDGGVDLREEAQRTVEENHKLQAEVERLGEENKKRQKDMELLFASYKQALEDIRRLHWDLQAAKEGKQP